MKFYNKYAGKRSFRTGAYAYKMYNLQNADFKRFLKIIISLAIIASFLALMFFTPYGGKLFADNKIKVFLDAGHGGSDPGAVWYGFQEKVADLDIALRVKSKLEANGFSVAMTRTGDSSKSLDERVAMANSSGADLFVSIHNNASISPYAHGTETYWCANGVAGSSQLASLIQSNVVSSTGRANRGVKTANFRVIKYTTMPAALVEGVFMSNQTESDLLKTAEFREKIANGIYNGIKKFAEGINKSSSGGSSSGSQTSDTSSATTTTDAGQNQNTYSDTSGTNSSGFTVKVNLPENGARLFSQFELRGWAADLRGTPAKKLTKIEVYRAPERNEANLLGKIEDFETNVLGSEGVLNGGWSLALDVEKLSEGENILYIYAFDKDKNYSIGNLRVNAVKSGDISEINLNPISVPGGPYSGQINTDVKFNGTGSYDPDGVIDQYLWDFGDGTTSDISKPVHKYTEKGTYTVTLTVKDGQGKSSATVSTTAAIIDPSEESTSTETTAGSTETGQDEQETAFENVSNGTSFTGYIDISAEALVKIFEDKNSTKTDRAARLAPLYIKYAKLFNLRADLAWAQMIHETGFLEYTGDVKPNQNNFAGIGATGGGVPGDSFATEELGVIAHFAHLAWYYFPSHVNEYCNRTYDPRHFGDGHINYTANTTLGFLNGRWAPGSTYTDKIILFANQVIQGIAAPLKTTETTASESSVTANAGPDSQCNAGQSITFDASESIITLTEDETVSYLWDWDGDGKFDQTVDTAVVKHTFETAGIFDVTLKVLLSSGVESTDKINVTVNSIPAADAGGPYSVEAGKQITLDGSKSGDSDGTIKNYLWDFGDGTSGSGMSPSHVYAEPGNYTVKLTVVDDRDAPSTTVSVTVEVTEEETQTSESTTSTSDTSAEETTAETEDTTQESTTGSSADETAPQAALGETTGETTAAETTAPNTAPTADAGGPYSAKVDEQITLDGSKSSDSDGQVSEYIWDFGDGSTGTGQKPSKTYTKAGTYTVKLTVKDEKGLASSVAQATATIAEKVTQPQYPVNTSIITNSTSFIGYHEVTVEQLVNVFIKKGSSQVDRARRIAPLYIQYGKLFNIRADIAWAQMIHETGFLAYTGDVKPDQNNFVGIGATGGGVPGNSFATEELGIIAHYAHLAWYYYPNHVNQYCNSTYDPRHFGSTHYKYTGDTTVGFLNGRWAPGATYTDKILLFANQIYGN
jgi:N-acetylmuramoyl-L-alanine amidase/PKD repeat protein